MTDDPETREPVRVVVRRAEPDDAAAFRDMMGQPRAQRGTLQLPFPSLDMWRARLSDPPPERHSLVACLDTADGRPVGNLGVVVESSPRRSHVASLGMAVHDEFAGRGVGTALMQAALDLCDRWLQVRRVELSVYVDNGPAIALYEKFGFVAEGTQRAAAFRDGEYVDLLLMARLHPGLTHRA